MSVRSTFTQTGPKTAKIAFHSEAVAETPPATLPSRQSAVVLRTNATDAVVALLGMLFGIPHFDHPPEPRYPALPSNTGSAQPAGYQSNTAFKITGRTRERESALILRTYLFVLTCPAGTFAAAFTDKPAPQAEHVPRPVIQSEQRDIHAASQKPAPRFPRSSLDNLASPAGRAASGIPLFPRHTSSEEMAATRTERHKPSEPIVPEVPDAPAANAEVAAETRAEVESVATQTAAVERQHVSQEPSGDVYAAYRFEQPATGDTTSAVESTPFPYQEYADALMRTTDESAMPSFAAQAPTIPQYDPQLLAQYENALATQRPADETESPAAQPQIQYEHDPQVFAQYANALAEPPASEPSSDDQPRSGAAS